MDKSQWKSAGGQDVKSHPKMKKSESPNSTQVATVGASGRSSSDIDTQAPQATDGAFLSDCANTEAQSITMTNGGSS
eukprot:10114926-Karenia_brevis.AAC.1